MRLRPPYSRLSSVREKATSWGGDGSFVGVIEFREVEVGFDDFLDVWSDGSVLELEGGVPVASFAVGEFEDEVVFDQFVEFFLCDVEVFANGGGGV